MSAIDCKAEVKVNKNRMGGYRYWVYLGDKEIGVAWKMVGAGFGLRIHGVYWRADKPNLSGGATSIWVKRLKDIPEFVTTTVLPVLK